MEPDVMRALIVYLVGALATFCLTLAIVEQQDTLRRFALAVGYALIWPAVVLFLLLAAA